MRAARSREQGVESNAQSVPPGQLEGARRDTGARVGSWRGCRGAEVGRSGTPLVRSNQQLPVAKSTVSATVQRRPAGTDLGHSVKGALKLGVEDLKVLEQLQSVGLIGVLLSLVRF